MEQRIIPAKNGGWLTPGNPGNKGGGVTPFTVRQAALEGTSDAVPILIGIAQGGDDYVPMEKIAAISALHRIMGTDIKVMIESHEPTGAILMSAAVELREYDARGEMLTGEQAIEVFMKHIRPVLSQYAPCDITPTDGEIDHS